MIECLKGETEAAVIEEYCEGRDLSYHIKNQSKKGRPFEPEVVEQWVLQMLLVLDYLHSNKIIHRNIKPSSIYLTLEGNVKVGAFELSKVILSPLRISRRTSSRPLA